MSIPIIPKTPRSRHARGPKKRPWPWIIGILAAVLAGVVVYGISMMSSGASLPKALPQPTMQAIPTAHPTSSTASSSTPTPTPTPIIIPEGQVTQIYLPAANPSLTIDAPVLKMPTSCKSVIQPPEDGPDKLKVFQCDDFAMAGTNSSGNVIITGHTSALPQYDGAVLNKVRAQIDDKDPGKLLVGREIFLRTTTSGTNWLAYKISAVVTPTKAELPYDAEVWVDVPGGLRIVTCLSQEGLPTALQNIVVIAQLEGVHAP
ncbi:MAG TPA: hypothetical protein VN081_00615 [Dongiaceae bacterium]|nr:hypothetical protein [Dongiaceae bacterium]